MKTGVSLLLALFAVICFPLLSLAIDPGNSGDIHDKFCQGENGDFP